MRSVRKNSRPPAVVSSTIRKLHQHITLLQPLASTTMIAEDIIEETSSVLNDSSNEDFNWFKTWHPLVPVEFLDPEKPHAFKLLGIDVVVWNDGPVDKSPLFGPRKNRANGAKKTIGNWRVFVDQCPHRKVPLSEGRIEDDGSLFCSYHGWRYDGEGAVVDVPQLYTDNDIERIRKNPKSNCNSYPVEIVNGLLWVWPDASDNSKIQSALTKVPTLKVEDAKEENIWKGIWNFRELPYGHDFFIENVVDPAHVGVSHHNIVGSRYEDQKMTLKTIQPLSKDGFSVLRVVPDNEIGATTEFNAPAQVIIKSPYGDKGASQYLELYSSPSRPGFCNHVGRMVIVKDETGQMPKLLKTFTAPLPIWLNHIISSAFLNQDALFLHAQERSLAHTKEYRASHPDAVGDNYAKSILPISADKGVLQFRTWMRLVAGGYIPFKGDTTMPATNNDVVFDVYNAHTKHCKNCQVALKNLKKIRFASFFFAALMATVRPKKLGVVGSTAAALFFSGIGGALSKLIGMFYRYEFSHADNH